MKICLMAMVLLGLGAVASANAQSVFDVDDDRAECPAAQFRTIQAAVDAVGPGTPTTIHVCPGTYQENVLITGKPALSIFGDAPETTLIAAVPGTAGPIVEARDTGDVEVALVTLSGRSQMSGAILFGLRFHHAGGHAHDLVVRDVRDVGGSGQGVGVRAESSGVPMAVTVDRGTFENITRVSISANGLGVRARTD